ncbi:Inner membrane ABC transporter permease protein YdcV [Variovorax sp. SRS16]|uniref:ABC transporter permease n=1 Tax=Variovorax sp. SRS16 TaxID=282217 RepID=UPI001316B3F3|nr:ABC transporter permease [Variovorax sp. SRS16]VTU15018.1 Inner membrane ABC transporter permease protein YdcV [Variovorax sp. SRS16]
MSNASRPGPWKITHRVWLYLAAAVALVFLIAPIFIVIPMSFSASRYLDFPPQAWSLRWYAAYFSSLEWTEATKVSLQVAVLTCLLATPIGVAAAYAIHMSESPAIKRLHSVLLLPLMVPNIIVAIGIYFVYARLSLVGTITGLVLAHVMLAIPFVVITALAGLRQSDMSLERAARSLGCNRFQAFMKATLPNIKPSVISGALFAFITSLDEVLIAIFVSSGDNTTLTKIMFTTLRDEIDPRIAAVSTLLIVASLAIALTATLVQSRKNTRPQV